MHTRGYKRANETSWNQQNQPTSSRPMARGNWVLQSALAVLSLLSIAAACLNECCPRDPVRCTGSGDPHYTTFDGLKYDFQGNCEYVLAKPCALTKGAPDWSVLGKNVPCGATVTCTDTITVNVYGKQFVLHSNSLIEVLPAIAPFIATLPYRYEKRVSVAVGANGKLILKTDFGLTVTFGGNSFEIELPKSDYYGNTCGLCGLLNASPKDDFLLPDGTIAPDATTFGNSWNTNPKCGPPKGKRQAIKPVVAITQAQAQTMCRASLMAGVLLPCNKLVNPDAYMAACIFDVVATGDKNQMCAILEGYARECRLKGLVLQWRRSDLCPMPCPTGMVYMINGPTFVPTCEDPKGDAECCNPLNEGCFCPAGLVLNEGKCIDPKTCGCVWEGDSFMTGATWLQDNCQRQCTCSPSHEVKCTEVKCHESAFCVSQLNHLQLCMCKQGTMGDGINFCNPI